MKPHKSHVIQFGSGLISARIWRPFFSGYATHSIQLLMLLREDLVKRISSIREKDNGKSRYFGYSLEKSSDKLYIYVQHKKLVVDIDIPRSETETLQALGFRIKLRRNFQYKAGWLTGWLIPYDKLQGDRQRKEIVDFICQAF